jgi:hypothetical protein
MTSHPDRTQITERSLRELDFVHRAPNTLRSLGQHVGVDPGCLHILVFQEFLQCSNLVTILQEVSRKGMTERMTARPLG